MDFFFVIGHIKQIFLELQQFCDLRKCYTSGLFMNLIYFCSSDTKIDKREEDN